jgi:ABC-type multidrug transport system fused ATPase/permease subunit
MRSTSCIPRLFRLALQHRIWLGALVAATLFGAIAITWQMASLSRIIDGAFLQRAGLNELRMPILWVAGGIFLRATSLWLSELAGQEIAVQVKEQLRNRLMRSLTGCGPLLTQREKAGAAGERIFEILDKDRLPQPTAGIAQSRANRLAAETVGASDDEGQESSGNGSLDLADDFASRNENATIPLLSVPIHVRFQNVDFQYPSAVTPAVRGLNFDLRPGFIHLLAGPSGAGKSTVVRLLLRFVQPTSGDVLVNGQPLIAIPSELWRTRVAFVSQHPHFFGGSVLDNLRAACPEATLEQVRTAARMAEADDFVMDLPQGYDTPISEAAARFSGGERQRLAIARAFLKNSPLLLLDEPVSQVDAATAKKLQQAFLRLSVHRTTLIIAHQRLEVIEPDTVFVLSGGCLVELMEATSLTAVRDGRALPRSIDWRTLPSSLEVRMP